MLTLKELKELVTPSEDKDYLTPKKLRENGGLVVARLDMENSALIVYANGFVLYQNGNHATAFTLYGKKGYFYDYGNEKVWLGDDYFDDQPWYVRLILEAEDRIDHNQAERERNISYEAVAEDWSAMTDENAFVEKQVLKEEMLEEIMGAMTERQKDCVYRYYFLHETFEEIGLVLGMTKAATRKNVLAGLARCKKVLGKNFLEDYESV